jgi:DNA-directed RNA polymerase subunit omega
MQPKDGFDSNYRYILVAARRARQLQSGAPTLVETRSRKACKIAQEEIGAGKVSYSIVEKQPVVPEVDDDDSSED